MSEKLDGVRALWDGTQLRFRSGRVVAAPAGVPSRLPRTPLDGELWLARGRFDELSGLVRRASPDDALWRELRYMLFELPGAPAVRRACPRAGAHRQRRAGRNCRPCRSAWSPNRPALATLLADTGARRAAKG